MIDPNRLYSFSEAATLIPSVRGGHISLVTLWRWHREGRFEIEYRAGRTRHTPLIRGHEILRLTQTERVPAAAPLLPRSKRSRQAGYRRAIESLAREGLNATQRT